MLKFMEVEFIILMSNCDIGGLKKRLSITNIDVRNYVSKKNQAEKLRRRLNDTLGPPLELSLT